MQREIITLQNIKGIGDKISEKIIKSVGGEEELQKIVDNVDVEKIINIDGISQRKAIDIMNQLLNNPKYEFIKSDRAMELYEDIINKILAYSNTAYSKNRILLLSPSKDIKKINQLILNTPTKSLDGNTPKQAFIKVFNENLYEKLFK